MDQHFTSLVKEFGPSVFRQAYSMLGNRSDAEEAAQDVFMIINKKLETFRGESALSTWIYTITFRACLRRRAGKKGYVVSLDDEASGYAGMLQDPEPDPETRSIQRETNEILAEQIALLPVHESAVIALFYMEGKHYDEIGSILDMPPGTVAITLHRARKHLRKILHSHHCGIER
jgi:RNA polymerase sigma-70 factor, ECF subfamily